MSGLGWYSSFEDLDRPELRQALKHADISIFERVLQFLENDPRTFGSGYAKVMMWRYIRRYYLHHYSKGLASGEGKRLELKQMKREIRSREGRSKNPYYGGSSFWGDDVYKAVTDPSIWKDNQVIYREPNQEDYPIFRNATHK